MESRSFLKHNAFSEKRSFFFGLRSKMVIQFGILIVFILGIAKFVEFYGIPFTNFKGEYANCKKEIYNKLNLVADLKKERLERWIEERKDDVSVLIESEFMKNSVRDIIKIIKVNKDQGREGDELWRAVRREKPYQSLVKHLSLVKSSYAVYDKIKIIDKSNGTTITSTHSADIGKKIPMEDLSLIIANPKDAFVRLEEDSHYEHTGLTLLMAYSINYIESLDDGGRDISVILMCYINSEDFIKPMLHAGGGLGITGEVLLVDKEVKIITTLKHPLEDGTIATPLEYEIKAEPAIRAARGEEGVVAAVDYRGVSVFSCVSLYSCYFTSWLGYGS